MSLPPACTCLYRKKLSGNALIAHLLEVEHVVLASWFEVKPNEQYMSLCAPDGIWTMLSNSGYGVRPFHISLNLTIAPYEFTRRLKECVIRIRGIERSVSSITKEPYCVPFAQTICLTVQIERFEPSQLTDAEFKEVKDSISSPHHVQIYRQSNAVAIPRELFGIHLQLLRRHGMKLGAPYFASQQAQWDYDLMVASLDKQIDRENEEKATITRNQMFMARQAAAKAMLAEIIASAERAKRSAEAARAEVSNAKAAFAQASEAVARARAVRRANILTDAAQAGLMATSASSSRLNASLAVESALMSVARAQSVRAARLEAAARRKTERRRSARQRIARHRAARREAANQEAANQEAALRDVARLEVATAISFVLRRIEHPPAFTCPPKSRRQAARHEVRGHHFNPPKIHISTKRGLHNSRSRR
jgi:hypothetical protein